MGQIGVRREPNGGIVGEMECSGAGGVRRKPSEGMVGEMEHSGAGGTREIRLGEGGKRNIELPNDEKL